MLSIDPVKLALYAFLALALGIAGTLGFRAIYDRGVASQVSVTKGVQKELDELKAELKAANATATQKAQEAAQMARTIEDEQRRRIAETEALTASYEAAAALRADERERRLRAALETRACRRDAANRARVSEAAAIESRSAEAAGLVVESTARNLRGYGEGVERLNGQFTICYRVTSNGEQLTRR